ncbi:type III secretion system outer membrane ring subunit SctC [Paraburkholderia bonniea]|uniref:type III secretion system outer membrane ring subunit SctC n=1 Tax=Paraburkholderia bonniea TaxID=2152891 RepID=UPI00129187AC|nr:type III secretion system outer membrane ring subunit SctC [Paraburkholderia bonniea]
MTFLPRLRPPALVRRPLYAALFALLTAGASPALLAATPWPAVNYSYYAENTPVQRVLSDFAAAFSLTPQISPLVTGRVSGRFNTATPTEYLNRLGGIYGFTWFAYGGTLYINPANQVITRTLPVTGGSTIAAREALTALGVLDPRFGWGDMADSGVVMVSGPPPYVDLVERTLASLPRVDQRQTVAVFRLQHAQVDDRAIQYRDTQIVIPGVATTLRNLLMDAGSVGNSMRPAASGPAAGAGPMALPGLNPLTPLPAFGSQGGGAERPGALAGAGAPGGAGGSGGFGGSDSNSSGIRGAVEAFPALNAIVVQDSPDRMPVYAALIKQLDVPTAVIEIEAMVIDINKERMSQLGVTWSGQIGSIAGAVGSGPTVMSIGAGAAAVASGGASLLASAGNYFASNIQALEQTGDAHVVSRPSVVTSDNIGAVLNLNQTFYVKVTGERVASVTPVTASTTLKVTPRVVQRDSRQAIQMSIDIQDGRVVQDTVDGLPTVVTSAVSTQAIVRDGESLLVGGYNTDEAAVTASGVPFLSKIPVLGYLFGGRQSTEKQRERMFLIRPHIITLASDVEPRSAPGSLPSIQPPALQPFPVVPALPTPTVMPNQAPYSIAPVPR